MSTTPSQQSPSAFLTQHHRDCDSGWAPLEQQLDQGDLDAAQTSFDAFEQSMLLHFQMEEEVLFPAFEQTTGAMGGPTHVMRMEHQQMKGLLEQMRASLAAGQAQAVLDQGDTLLMLLQQHNVKEESILYPAFDQVLGSHWAELHRRLEELAS